MMPDKSCEWCEHCEDMMPMTPVSADVPGMDVEMYLERFYDLDTGERPVRLVVVNNRTEEEAEFKVNFCPMCGRRLAERGR